MPAVCGCVNFKGGRLQLFRLRELASSGPRPRRSADGGWHRFAEGVRVCSRGVRERNADNVFELVYIIYSDAKLHVPDGLLLHHRVG